MRETSLLLIKNVKDGQVDINWLFCSDFQGAACKLIDFSLRGVSMDNLFLVKHELIPATMECLKELKLGPYTDEYVKGWTHDSTYDDFWKSLM